MNNKIITIFMFLILLLTPAFSVSSVSKVEEEPKYNSDFFWIVAGILAFLGLVFMAFGAVGLAVVVFGIDIIFIAFTGARYIQGIFF